MALRPNLLNSARFFLAQEGQITELGPVFRQAHLGNMAVWQNQLAGEPVAPGVNKCSLRNQIPGKPFSLA